LPWPSIFIGPGWCYSAARSGVAVAVADVAFAEKLAVFDEKVIRLTNRVVSLPGVAWASGKDQFIGTAPGGDAAVVDQSVRSGIQEVAVGARRLVDILNVSYAKAIADAENAVPLLASADVLIVNLEPPQSHRS